jgi:hypothetical protein
LKTWLSLAAVLLLAAPAFSQADGNASSVKIKPKRAGFSSEARAERRSAHDGSLMPDTEVIDAPTTAVLDNYGFGSRSRFYSRGGLLQYINFGVYPNVNIGASGSVDGLIGDEKNVRLRAPTAQVKWRFYDGDEELPSLAVGFDGQGYRYNAGDRRFNQRQRGFYFVGTKEIGAPGLEIHPSINISDFDGNSIFGSIPLTLNIRDKVGLMVEWDNINNWSDSRLNAGIRFYVTSGFHVDFAARSLGAGGFYSDGAARGSERIVQLRYATSF